jgi:sterol desaturase/sphingolipid hydroxylase (fatty acid hydroxylase superfamily)
MQESDLFSLFGLGEASLRLGVFLSVFVIMALAEWALPKRQRSLPQGRRWLTNWGIVVLDSVVTRLVMPILPIGMALYATGQGWGLFNLLSIPTWLSVLVSFLILDFAIWLQHLLSHRIPLFWKLHKVHHVDRDIDVSTALRFHPLEILLSLVYKIVWVLVFGAPAVAVFLFEVVLNAAALFNHANVRLPEKLDRLLRLAVVTPDMHRVHHSNRPRETHSNFGFNLSIWDRMFRTYVAQPTDGHEGMTIGLDPYQNEKPSQFVWSLLLPFLKR